MSRRASRSLVFAVVLGGAVLWPAAAFGHAAFIGSDPKAGARLEASPPRVIVNFTEPLNRRLSTVKLIAVDGDRSVAATIRAPSARRLELVPAARLPRGAYRVQWHTVSTEDGHALEGSFSFGVQAAAVGGGHSLEQSPLARGGWLRVLLRGALYAFALALVAALLLPLLTGRRRWLVPDRLSEVIPVEAVREREARLTGAVGWLTVFAAVAATLAEAADAAGGLSPARISDFLLANQAGVARALVVVLFVGAALARQRHAGAGAALAVLALGGIAASGHASSASPRVPSVLNDWLHLVSAAVWVGGIALVVGVWTPTLRRAERPARLAIARHVLPVFGRVALPAFALVTTTGLVSLLTQLGHLPALWETSYGLVLAAKVALVGAIAMLSAGHAWRLRPRLLAANPHPPERVERRHWRLLRAEPVVGAGVVAAVALLVAFPLPPRQLGEAGEAAAASACDPCPLPRPAADELAVADRAGRQLVAAWIRRRRDGLAGTVRLLDYRGRPPRAGLDILGASTTTCGSGCRRFRAPSADAVRVAVLDAGRRYVVALPARWRREANGRAGRLLARAQASMRRLRSVREFEEVTSGPGSYASTAYWLQAPDRMRYRTGGRIETVVKGRTRWLRTPGSGWQRGAYGGGLTFRTRSWFRWTTYGRAVRLLDVRRSRGRRLAQLALMDEGTPVWLRVWIDLASNRVIRERMVSRGHFMDSRYFAFNRPVQIDPPEASRGR